MTSVGAIDATMGRLFPLVLGYEAHMWFTSLALYSIDSFEQLTKLLLDQFATMVLVLQPSSV